MFVGLRPSARVGMPLVATLLLLSCSVLAGADNNDGGGGGGGGSVPFEVPPIVADVWPPSSLLFVEGNPPPLKNAAGRSLLFVHTVYLIPDMVRPLVPSA